MSPASVKPRRPWVFGAVSTGLMVGHGLVAMGAIATGLLGLMQGSPLRQDLHRLSQPLMIAVLCVPCLHVLLMLIMPLWSWLAARTQTRVSRLWAWLGYLIPVASYWLPAQTLHRLAEGTDLEAARLRTVIVAWGVTRGVASPSFFIGIVMALVKMTLSSNMVGWIIVTYVLIVLFASNLLSLLVIAQMRHHLASHSTDERHAEVFT